MLRLILATCSVLVLLAGPTNALPGKPIAATCHISQVTDGDTLRLTCAGVTHKLRLLGYDTPEVYHPRCPAERLAGQAASNVLRALVGSGPVSRVQFHGHDRYGRVLADLWIDGQDVGSVMRASGLALPYAGRKRPNWCQLLGG